MEKEFVQYTEALILKEIGFDEPCFGYYYNKELSFGARTSYGEVIEAPTFSQAFRWFREKHNLMFQIFYLRNGNHASIIHKTTPEYMDLVDQVTPSSGCFDEIVDCYSYEEAELACLRKLIKIVKIK